MVGPFARRYSTAKEIEQGPRLSFFPAATNPQLREILIPAVMCKGIKDILEPGGTEVTTAAGGARRYRKPLKTFRWPDIRALFTESLSGWNRHKAPRLGAALAFYALLSLAPLLLVVASVAGLALGHQAAE